MLRGPTGRFYYEGPGAVPTSDSGNSFSISTGMTEFASRGAIADGADILYESNDSLHLRTLAHYVLCNRESQWDCGLDGCATAGIARMDWSCPINQPHSKQENGKGPSTDCT